MKNKSFNFTKEALKNLPSASKGRRTTYHDTGKQFLSLRVTDKGVKSFFVMRRVNGKVVRLTLGQFPSMTISVARNETEKVIGEMAKGENPAQSKRDKLETAAHTLAEAIDRYLNDPDRMLDRYHAGVLNWWGDNAKNSHGHKIGKKPLNALKRSDFSEARDRLRKLKKHPKKPTSACQNNKCDCPKLTPATVNRRMSAISAVLTEALEWEWIETNPSRLRRLKEDNERTPILNPDEQKRLLDACKASDEPHLYPLVVTALLSGARAGELLGLRWKDVDLDKGLARLIDTKNNTNRPIPIRGHALELLREIRESDQVVDLHGEDFVFKNKTGFTPFYYRKAWVEVRRDSRLKDFRFHDLRHVAASHLAMAGATQRELMEVLGHKSAQMTKRYSHFFDQHIAELGDRLQERLFPEQK